MSNYEQFLNATIELPPVGLMSFSDAAVGQGLVACGVTTSSPLSIPWNQITGGANYSFYVPFRIAVPIVARKMVCYNGGTASGNIDMGIYSATIGSAKSKLVSFGSVAQSGINTTQIVDIADTTLAPGRYIMSLAASSATATFQCAQLAGSGVTAAQIIRLLMCTQQASNFPLGSTATPAVAVTGAINLPFFGIILDTDLGF